MLHISSGQDDIAILDRSEIFPDTVSVTVRLRSLQNPQSKQGTGQRGRGWSVGVGQEEIRYLVMDWALAEGREASRREFVFLLWTAGSLIQTPLPG